MSLIEKKYDQNGGHKMIGTQCNGCNEYKDGKCTRVGTNAHFDNGTKDKVGVCWMEESEGEY